MLVFGGEHVPRTPIDSNIHTLEVMTTNKEMTGSWDTIKPTGKVPEARVASA